MGKFVEKNVRLRFEEKYLPHPVTGCWTWLASKTADGYGVFWDGERNRRGHQFAYLVYRGDVPEGMQLDHLCRNRGCVNPNHLEVVTPKTNQERGRGSWMVCKHGHSIDGFHLKSGKRHCKTCQKQRSQIYEMSGKRPRRRISVLL